MIVSSSSTAGRQTASSGRNLRSKVKQNNIQTTYQNTRTESCYIDVTAFQYSWGASQTDSEREVIEIVRKSYLGVV